MVSRPGPGLPISLIGTHLVLPSDLSALWANREEFTAAAADILRRERAAIMEDQGVWCEDPDCPVLVQSPALGWLKDLTNISLGHVGRKEPTFTWENTNKAAVLRSAAGLG